MTTWREQISRAMEANKDSWQDVEANTLAKQQETTLFDDGFGCVEGVPFTLWTKNFVYFPVVYDGAEWVGSVPRNPNGVATPHVGG